MLYIRMGSQNFIFLIFLYSDKGIRDCHSYSLYLCDPTIMQLIFICLATVCRSVVESGLGLNWVFLVPSVVLPGFPWRFTGVLGSCRI